MDLIDAPPTALRCDSTEEAFSERLDYIMSFYKQISSCRSNTLDRSVVVRLRSRVSYFCKTFSCRDCFLHSIDFSDVSSSCLLLDAFGREEISIDRVKKNVIRALSRVNKDSFATPALVGKVDAFLKECKE